MQIPSTNTHLAGGPWSLYACQRKLMLIPGVLSGGEEAAVTDATDTNTLLADFVASDGRAGRPHLRRADPPSPPETVSTVTATFD